VKIKIKDNQHNFYSTFMFMTYTLQKLTHRYQCHNSSWFSRYLHSCSSCLWCTGVEICSRYASIACIW